MQINERIKQARLSKKWSQQEIAEKLEESRSSYAEWERETIPRADILVKIAAATGVPIMEFIKALNEEVAFNGFKDEKPSNAGRPSADYLAGKLESKEETIQQIEARRQDAERMAKLMQQHYEDGKAEKNTILQTLNRNQEVMIELLKPIKEKTEAILTNSAEVKDNMSYAVIEMQSEHRAIMDTLDKIGKLPAGTTVGRADILEDAAHAGMKKGHKKSVPGK